MHDDLYDLDLLKPVYVPMPDALRELLASGTTKTEDVLRQDITFRLFRSANPQLVNFFVVHIDQLLRIAFDEDESTDLSAKAFAILEHSQPIITSALLAGQKLNRTACSIIGNDDIHNKSLLLNRLASLTFCALYADANAFIASCGYILQLIGQLSEPSILFLFESMCSPDQGFQDVQNWLVRIGFPQTILQEIGDFPPQRDSTRLSQEANLLCGLFRVICVCASSPILGPKFCTYNFVTILNETVGDYPDFIEYQRWETFSALYCRDTFENMRGLFPQAVEFVSDPAQSITRSGVAALDLLTVMVQFDKVLVPFMIQMNLVSTVLGLVVRNPDHSILHFAALEFFEVAFRNDGLRAPVIDEVVAAIRSGFTSGNRCQRGTVFRLLKLLRKISKTDPKLAARLKKNEAFGELVRTRFSEYRGIMKTPYGGPIRYAAEDNVQALAERAIHHMGI
jgi:hypothetical protein